MARQRDKGEVAETGKARARKWTLSGIPGLPSCLTASTGLEGSASWSRGQDSGGDSIKLE